MKKISLIVFDMAGTTVNDVIDGVPLVLKSYDDAFRKYGIVIPMDVLNDQRGRDKRTVINELGGSHAKNIYDFFLKTLLKNITQISEIDGTSRIFTYLHNNSIQVTVSSGFPADVTKAIVDHLKWAERGLIDYWTCSELVGTSRPDPAMIHRAMEYCNISDLNMVIKIDDTVKGIEEGLRAGVITLGVLTGTQTKEKLQAAQPTEILNSIRDLPTFLQS